MNQRIKASYIIALLAMLIIFVIIFFLIRPQRDSELIGGWKLDGSHTSTLWLYPNGSGRVEPENSTIAWRTRRGQLMIESMGVKIDYEYLITDNTTLILTRTDPYGTIWSRTYTRVRQ